MPHLRDPRTRRPSNCIAAVPGSKRPPERQREQELDARGRSARAKRLRLAPRCRRDHERRRQQRQPPDQDAREHPAWYVDRLRATQQRAARAMHAEHERPAPRRRCPRRPSGAGTPPSRARASRSAAPLTRAPSIRPASTTRHSTARDTAEDRPDDHRVVELVDVPLVVRARRAKPGLGAAAGRARAPRELEPPQTANAMPTDGDERSATPISATRCRCGRCGRDAVRRAPSAGADHGLAASGAEPSRPARRAAPAG